MFLFYWNCTYSSAISMVVGKTTDDFSDMGSISLEPTSSKGSVNTE